MTHQKTLKSFTIIPDHLYVERDADRQVRMAIEDVERPGYVLVSRQMGKTNLLLHAKRKFQTSGIVIAYVDLSNVLNTERECFQNIINTITSSHHTKFLEAVSRIEKSRNETDLPPSVEHEIELKILLSYVEKLVIILDEVDALGLASYSDQIFAQIRSIYFSRANFSEYYKLTYLLSGVAEPSELIKNKKTSPFNIGQKIFLDDFKFVEVQKFINKARLPFDHKIEEKIYEWTQGHPRMTWEVCSACEDYFFENGIISVSDVDRIVYSLYIEKENIPPVDHIKTLVLESRKLQESIISIHYGKGDALQVEDKNKLYLAGVISSTFSSEKVAIKNKILESILSLEWLEAIEVVTLGSFELAQSSHSSKHYESAITNSLKYISETDQVSPDRMLHLNVILADSYYNLKRYDEALIRYLDIKFDKNNLKEFYYRNLHSVGLCYLALKDYDKASTCFKEFLEFQASFLEVSKAKINLSACYFKIDKVNNFLEALNLNQEVILSLEGDCDASDLHNYLLTTALYNIGNMYVTADSYKESKEFFSRALQVANKELKPAIYLAMLKGCGRHEEKKEIIKECSICLSSFSNVLLTADLEFPLKLNDEIVMGLCVEAAYEKEIFKEFINLVVMSNLIGDKTLKNYLKDLANFAQDKEYSMGLITNILEFNYVNNINILDTEEKFHILKFLSLYVHNSSRDKYYEAYMDFAQVSSSQIKCDDIDIVVWFNILSHYISTKKNNLAQKALSVIKHLRSNKVFEKSIAFMLIDYQEVELLLSLRKTADANLKASELLKFIDARESLPSSAVVNETLVETYRQNTIKLLKLNIKTENRSMQKPARKYQRNEYVSVMYFSNNNEVIREKYKKIQADLIARKCRII